MTDPESRDPILPHQKENPIFVYQIEHPIGTLFSIVAHNAIEAAEWLSAKNIEPFMIRRAGVLIDMGEDCPFHKEN